jgi:hypothetical protein
MKRKPPAKHRLDASRALSLLFMGYNAREVGDKLGFTHVPVYEARKKFVSAAKENDIMSAAKKYRIEDQVGILMEIGGTVEKTKIDASRAPLGLRIVDAVESFGVGAEEAPKFIEACYAEAMKQNMTPESFVATVYGLQRLHIVGERDYNKLLEKVENANNELSTTQAKVGEYKKIEEAARNDSTEAIRKKDTTLEELDRFSKLRDGLAEYHLDLADVEKTRNCIVNVGGQGGDPKAVVALCSRRNDLTVEVRDAENRLEELRKDEETVGERLGRAKGELASKTQLVDRVREAESLGIKPSQLGVIVEKARELGARHSLDIKEAISRLEVDLAENWESKLGFEDERISQEAKLRAVDEKLRLAEERECVASANARAKEQALAGLAELTKHVTPSEIVEFKRIICDSGLDLPTFRADVQSLGSVTAVADAKKHKKEAEIERLTNQVGELEGQVTQLKREKQRLLSNIETLNTQTLTNMNEVANNLRTVADALVWEFSNEETGFNATITRLGDESRKKLSKELGAFSESLERCLADARKQLGGFTADSEKLREDTWESGKLLGFNIHLVRLADLVAGKQMPTTEAILTMKMTVNAFIDYFARNKILDMFPGAREFNEQLAGAFR